MDPIITIKGLSVSYDRKRVLSNVFLNIDKGHVYGVLGPNGAGKSTLFKSILELTDPDSGTILVNGEDFKSQRKKIVYLPQRNKIDWSFPATVFDIALMGRYPHKKVFERISKKDKELALEALEEVDMIPFKDRQIGELSGGQQQRVFLARALCQEAEIFLFDEPFVGVDVTTEEKIVQILKSEAEKGNTLLVVHHDLSSVNSYFDKVILLNGTIVACGDTADTFTQENIKRTYGGQLSILHEALRL